MCVSSEVLWGFCSDGTKSVSTEVLLGFCSDGTIWVSSEVLRGFCIQGTPRSCLLGLIYYQISLTMCSILIYLMKTIIPPYTTANVI